MELDLELFAGGRVFTVRFRGVVREPTRPSLDSRACLQVAICTRSAQDIGRVISKDNAITEIGTGTFNRA